MVILRVLRGCVLQVAVISLLASNNRVVAHTTLGHMKIAPVAVGLSDKQLPSFFSDHISLLADCSAEPDLWKTPTPSGALKPVESPEHFLDMEYLNGGTIPDSREEFDNWCRSKQLSPEKVGTVPYAIAEWTDRLTVALAEHRQFPKDVNIQTKCLVYAGILSHYAEDASLPLHATKDYDGRVRSDGTSPKTGIHLKVDLLVEKLPESSYPKDTSVGIVPFENVKQAIANRLVRSNSEVGQIYDQEKDLPATNAPIMAGSPAESLAKHLLSEASVFTARLFVTAWQNSESVKADRYYHPASTVVGADGPQARKAGADDPNGQSRIQK
jgi:hypothetical protein